MRHRVISIGGASLRRHWNKGEAQRALQAGTYDYVVLQEQSTLPVKNAGRMHENVRLFASVIRAAGAKTALYLTWARRHSPQHQAPITHAYTTIGEEIGATVVPVGVVWERFLQQHDTPVLHDSDASHPSVAGSYLSACVFYATLFGRDPADNAAPVPLLDRGDAQLINRFVGAQLG